LRGTIPNYDELIKERSDAVASYMRGEVPQDVLNQVERGVAGANLDRFGTFGGTLEDRNRAGRIGQTSLALQQWGIGALPGVISSTPRAGVYDVSNFLGPTAAQRSQIRYGEFSARQGVGQQMANIPQAETIYGNAAGQVGGLVAGYYADSAIAKNQGTGGVPPADYRDYQKWREVQAAAGGQQFSRT